METDKGKEVEVQARELVKSIEVDLNERAVTLGKVYGFDFVRGQPDLSSNAPFKWTPIQEITYYQTMEKKQSAFIGQETRV